MLCYLLEKTEWCLKYCHSENHWGSIKAGLERGVRGAKSFLLKRLKTERGLELFGRREGIQKGGDKWMYPGNFALSFTHFPYLFII